MAKRTKDIPVHVLPPGIKEEIFVVRMHIDGLPDVEGTSRSHRDSGHVFILQEKGTTHIEIDFRQQVIQAPSLLYIHPSQVHRLIAFEDAIVSTWIISSEHVRPEYLTILEDLMPADPLALQDQSLAAIANAFNLCINLYEKDQEPLYHYMLKESCNTLVVLVAAQYLQHSKVSSDATRVGAVNRAFRLKLEQSFVAIKRPSAYAQYLNISTPYLNECVKAVTGYPVSWHIQQRVVLEAKRLLYHTDRSIKEIAGMMGYEDYPYFVRMFRKSTGLSPQAFRAKNRE